MRLGEFWRRLLFFLQWNRFSSDLDEEMRLHTDLRAASLVEKQGLDVGEAASAARRQFGNRTLIAELVGDEWGARWAEAPLKDLRFAARQIRKSPTFSAVVICSIALGIGANTAIFSFIDVLMLQRLPVQDPQTLTRVVAQSANGLVRTAVSYKLYQTMRSRASLTQLAAYLPLSLNVSIAGSVEPAAVGEMVSGNYFPLLGVNPAAGRAIGPEDDVIPGGHPVAMISYAYWNRRFGLAPATVGRTISISGKPFTIVGITPPGFFGVEAGTAPDIFVPLMMKPVVMPTDSEFNARNKASYFLLARVSPGRDLRQARAELDLIYLQENPPRSNPANLTPEAAKRLRDLIGVDWHISMTPAGGISDLQGQFLQPLFVLMAAVGVVLLIACANTANLMLVRTAARRPEFTMRLALGASRARLICQMLIESLMLAFLGGGCGILLAWAATKLLVVYMSAGLTPIVLNLSPDLRVLSFTAALSMLTGILCGIAPALHATRIDLAQGMQGVVKALGVHGRHRLGRMLTVAQVALSLVLVFGAGLLVRSLQNLGGAIQSTDENVLILHVEPRNNESRPRKELDRGYRELIRQVEEIPGVSSASMAETTPSFSGPGNFEGIRFSADSYSEPIGVYETYPNYFATAGIPLLAGRDLAASDLDADATPVCVVNEMFVRRFYPGENPIGKDCGAKARIAGVVQDSRLMNPTGVIKPMIYTAFLHSHTGRGALFLYVRVAGNQAAILPRVREAARNADPIVPQSAARTLAREMDAALVRQRLIAMLSSLFSALALSLTCVGLYGLLAFAVVRRRGELSIRMALGATQGGVLWMVLREALLLATAGVGIGVSGAFAAGRLVFNRIPGFLFEVKTTDPLTLLAAAALLVVVAGLAAYLPARRASHIDPMVALRSE
jgi:predicted permease